MSSSASNSNSKPGDSEMEWDGFIEHCCEVIMFVPDEDVPKNNMYLEHFLLLLSHIRLEKRQGVCITEGGGRPKFVTVQGLGNNHIQSFGGRYYVLFCTEHEVLLSW